MSDRRYAVIKRQLRSVDINNLDSDSPWVKLARERSQEVFGPNVRPCLWQAKVALATLKGEKHVLSIARTGSGKTLTFWLPVLLTSDGIIIVVVPLNILAEQNFDQLTKAGINTMVITAETATPANFDAIENGSVRVVVTNPELLMKSNPNSGFAKLFQNSSFTSKIMGVVIDEAHCVSQWGSFRPEYKEISRLHSVLPGIKFLITSATLPRFVLTDVLGILHITPDQLFTIHRSNDRPNVAIVVREIQHSLTSFADLDFLVDGWASGGPPPPKFLIIFDDKNECVKAAKRLRSRIPAKDRDKIKWHHSDMTSEFRVEEIDAIRKGEIIGMCATDTLGMGMDISDFLFVGQWKVEHLTICSFGQRLGRAARLLSLRATFVLFVEPKYFDYKKQAIPRKRPPDRSIQHPCSPSQPSETPLTSRSIASDHSEGSNAHLQSTTLPVQLRSLDEVKGDRNAVYAEFYRKGAAAVKSKPSNELEPPIDDIVNAEDRGLDCRRIPGDISFENSKLPTDHLLCDGSSPTGCPRCSPQSPYPCCDLCNPQVFDELFFALEPPPPAPPKPPKSALRGYEKEERDMALSQALNAWRQKATVDMYGLAVFKDVGSALVLNDRLLERLVDCAHHGKIRTVEDLRREVDWSLVEELGPDVVRIITEVNPPRPRARATRMACRTRRPRLPPPVDGVRRPLATNSRILNAPQATPAPIPVTSFYANPLLLPSISASLLRREPASLAHSTSASASAASRPSTGNQPPAKRMRCGVCGEMGHNRRRHGKDTSRDGPEA